MSRCAHGTARVHPRMRVAVATSLWGGLLGAILLLFAGTATAHPHAWIDLRVSLLFDDDGQLHTLRQEWAFDPTYSHLLLEDMDTTEPGLDMDTALRKMAVRMLENLREYDYFTEIRRYGRQMDTAEARDGELLWRQRRLHLRFELPVEPVRPDSKQPLQYRVYDPSYWIEILHDPGDVIHIEGGRGCEARLERARPEGWLVAYAATLNRDQRAPIKGLGRSFAEEVSIQCNEG